MKNILGCGSATVLTSTDLECKHCAQEPHFSKHQCANQILRVVLHPAAIAFQTGSTGCERFQFNKHADSRGFFDREGPSGG